MLANIRVSTTKVKWRNLFSVYSYELPELLQNGPFAQHISCDICIMGSPHFRLDLRNYLSNKFGQIFIPRSGPQLWPVRLFI